MFLPRRRLLLTATLSAAVLSACGGGGSSSAAPTNVTAVAGDQQIFITWDQASGVDYWLWFNTGTTTVNPGDKTASFKLSVGSPYLLNMDDRSAALVNGTIYALTLNGRTNGGPGGPGSTPVTATPRLSGDNWPAGATLGSKTLRGIAFGRAIGSSSNNSYVAVGDGGSIYNTPDTDADRIYRSTSKLNWITPTGTGVSSSIDLKAVVYASGLGNYYAVGTGGNVVYSSDINNWTTLGSSTTGTANTFNAIATNGSTLVAVGDNGTIRLSTNGTSWSTPTSISQDISGITLRGITYNNGIWIAVGSNGKVLTATDVNTWTVSTQSGDLTSVSSGSQTVDSTTTYYYIAVGADGTVLTSTDGALWTSASLGATLYTASVGSRLVALGANGAVYTRELDGTGGWTQRTSGTPGATMYGAIRAQNIYTAVGSGGSTIYSY